MKTDYPKLIQQLLKEHIMFRGGDQSMMDMFCPKSDAQPSGGNPPSGDRNPFLSMMQGGANAGKRT